MLTAMQFSKGHASVASVLDAARAALRPAPAGPAVPEGDPEDPRNTGPDFDDDIPF